MGEILNGNHTEGVNTNGHSNGFHPEVSGNSNGNGQTQDTLASLTPNGNHAEATINKTKKVRFVDISGLLAEIKAFKPRADGRLPVKSRTYYPADSYRQID